MSSELTFFSYSRTDSVFVLKLAKELRDAGAGLWLDQLDIKPGDHWDSAIEAAMNSASRIIVILSVASVSSNNVMDEVSFALETGKTVIPVIIDNCTPPFRLRRLQHIDFTGDYQDGLKNLLKVLLPSVGNQIKTENINKEKEQPQINVYKNSENLERHELIMEQEKGQDQLTIKKDSPKKYFFIGGALVFISFSVWIFINHNSNQTRDELIDKANEIQMGGSMATDTVEIKKEPDKFTEPRDNDKNVKANPISGSGNKTARDKEFESIKHDIIESKKNQKHLDTVLSAMDKSSQGAIRNISALEIGQEYQGGIIFYMDHTGKHGLIAAPFDQSGPIAWNFEKPIKTNVTKNNIGSGYTNTLKIVEATANGKSAAQICNELDLGGYSDWFLPSKDELNLLFTNREKIKGLGNKSYWSSSVSFFEALLQSNRPWMQSFRDGHQDPDIRGGNYCVRAIRAF